jgi:hypothetical protein
MAYDPIKEMIGIEKPPEGTWPLWVLIAVVIGVVALIFLAVAKLAL